MASVDYVYNYVLKLIRKTQSAGLSATEFQFFWNDAQRSYFDDLIGRFQKQNNGKEGLNTGLIENETIMTKLTPFTKNYTLSISSGQGVKPTDFIYTLALRINEKKVFQVNHDSIWAVKQDVIDPPSITNDSYYYTEYGNYYSFLPTAVTTASLDYIGAPQNIVWAYTLDTAGRQVYNSFGITGLNVIYGGVGYSTPTIAFSAPAAGGVQATGTLTVVGGVITAVVMTNIGYGYAGLTPTFTITGSSTTPASFGNPIVSVDPIWDNQSVIEISKRMLTTTGVSFKDGDFTNFGKSVQREGE
jgi:hypothetical protein